PFKVLHFELGDHRPVIDDPQGQLGHRKLRGDRHASGVTTIGVQTTDDTCSVVKDLLVLLPEGNESISGLVIQSLPGQSETSRVSLDIENDLGDLSGVQEAALGKPALQRNEEPIEGTLVLQAKVGAHPDDIDLPVTVPNVGL